ncbi:putative exported protein [Rubellimicrobium mesophilum DSM 19309]|uniref:Putative exported protein n=1 Tax=Rubellimicrobium mesophilum DSM 19309 TaxID=442562 RepID=A0A017HPW2_9RHOB|nr:DUF305 domain-containing protein [Rubellimicrobium mesophilum]EYD76517.1 putative exported protein [Rubellimicrobium mesophilum DSM 19309]
MRPKMFLILALTLASGAALAQTAETQSTEDAAAAGAEQMMSGEGHDMAGMDHSEMAMPDDAMSGFMGPMNDMAATMPMESSGDVDADFLLMMIPHHQSAIAMARVELERGDDQETRAMAQKVIDAQEAEIAEMRAMLERMGVEAPAE